MTDIDAPDMPPMSAITESNSDILYDSSNQIPKFTVGERILLNLFQQEKTVTHEELQRQGFPTGLPLYSRMTRLRSKLQSTGEYTIVSDYGIGYSLVEIKDTSGPTSTPQTTDQR